LIGTKKLYVFFLTFVFTATYSQSGFNFFGNNQKVASVQFKLINNLIVIPIEVNGQKLSFILDSGVDKTIFFNLSEVDSLKLNRVKKITLQGLGGGDPIDALLSQKNTMRIHNYRSSNQDIYVILKDEFDVSGRMGITIHGIIGHRLLKNAIVNINYATRRIKFYNPTYFKYPNCRKCEDFTLEFFRNKPYINTKVQLDTIGNTLTDVTLLIDTGGSEAIWLFENSKKEIKTPINYFKDILGEGLSGTIYGNKSRIKRIILGKYEIKNPTVSFLDSTSTLFARRFKKRNGSVGGNILKRFKVWIDYPNKKITLKKNGSFRGGFEYNMSGIDVVYNGKVLVREKETTQFSDSYSRSDSKTVTNNTLSLVSSYTYQFRPSFIVKYILPNSPGDKAGIKENDIILSINGAQAHELTLQELLNKFQDGDNRKIRMKIKRRGQPMKFKFRLVKKI